MHTRPYGGSTDHLTVTIRPLSPAQVYHQDRSQREDLLSILNSLLQDTSTTVIGACVAAFDKLCPDQLELLHPHYRHLTQVRCRGCNAMAYP